MPLPLPNVSQWGTLTIDPMQLPATTVPLALFCGAGALAAAVGIAAPPLTLPAAIVTVALGVAGISVAGLPSLSACLPALALLPGGGLVALCGWSAAAATAAVSSAALGELERSVRLRTLHNELRDAEHDHSLLSGTIERYPILLEACKELASARDLDSLATLLCSYATWLVPEARAVLVFMGSPTRQECQASQDIHGKPCPRQAGAEELFVASEARSLTYRQDALLRVFIPLRADRRQNDGAEASRGVLAVDMAFDETGRGVSLDLIQALGRLGGMGLATVDLVNQARSLALHDDLTGLYGQHEFLRRLEEQVAHARRHRHPLGVMMCDMDHLKRYNDRYGHLAGDAALKAIAKVIHDCLPSGAIACRYGGEEFAILASVPDPAQMITLAETLRRSIAKAQPDPAHPDRTLTAAIGYALLRSNEDGRAALSRADNACYRAKAAGRNRVEFDA